MYTLDVQIELEFGYVGFFMEGGKSEYPEKNPGSKDENQQQTTIFFSFLFFFLK